MISHRFNYFIILSILFSWGHVKLKEVVWKFNFKKFSNKLVQLNEQFFLTKYQNLAEDNLVGLIKINVAELSFASSMKDKFLIGAFAPSF